MLSHLLGNADLKGPKIEQKLKSRSAPLHRYLQTSISSVFPMDVINVVQNPNAPLGLWDGAMANVNRILPSEMFKNLQFNGNDLQGLIYHFPKKTNGEGHTLCAQQNLLPQIVSLKWKKV